MSSSGLHDFFAPVAFSVWVSVIASFVVFVFGIAAAWWMNRARFRGKTVVETLFLLPLVLPPTVVGLILLVLLGRRSWLGKLAEWLFDKPIVFSWQAAVIAASVVAFPLVFQTMKAGFASVDRDLEDAARSMGATEWQLFRHVTAPLARRSLGTAYVLGFARGLGEFGATLMIAGNIPGKTQTVPTAIYVAAESGNMTMAWWWTGSVVVISYALLLIVPRAK
ncbi:molybdate ABC transporter permease subunit [Paenibacillus ginsengarvi]|uniref:Molybdenum transport system permease n=1 Tax=Paenibacillus ginsengarvi TaxID=400777 RepID=A0A3B0CIR4_9BACL|nr:molybdate ABC transporter permease subunit [Paenibacillus ginsengarvi]RKN85273.1 molybdate ABC transporter permease subunit [Paenibacillus ginsengarvi]